MDDDDIDAACQPTYRTLELIGYSEIKHVFAYLGIRDLSALACASKTFQTYINSFWEDQCRTDSFKTTLNYIMKNERSLKEQLNGYHSVLKSGRYTPRWIFLQVLRLRTYRQPVIKVTNFAHLGNPENIIPAYDDILGRKVVVLKNVDWLHFFHKFKNVLPGKYRVILRMAVNKVNFLTKKEPAIISTTWTDCDGSHECKAEILYSQWLQLQQSFSRKTRKKVKLKGASISDYDVETEFFDLKLHAVMDVVDMCDVTFEYKDIANLGWKTGIKWDYVELRPLV